MDPTDIADITGATYRYLVAPGGRVEPGGPNSGALDDVSSATLVPVPTGAPGPDGVALDDDPAPWT